MWGRLQKGSNRASLGMLTHLPAGLSELFGRFCFEATWSLWGHVGPQVCTGCGREVLWLLYVAGEVFRSAWRMCLVFG